MSFKGGRNPSGRWGRLKPVDQDPLEVIGLPSKGDTKLLDEKTQTQYYSRIVERYLSFCTEAGKGDELLRRFSAMEISLNMRPKESSSSALALAQDPVLGTRPLLSSIQPTQSTMNVPNAPTIETLQSPANTKALSQVLMALRKLREGIVASKRVDDFSVQVYLFSIRLAVMVKHPETYHPAALFLLDTLNPRVSLTSVELQEVVGYLILDAACRRGDLSEAYQLRHRYRLRDRKLDAVLSSLAHDNYVLFRRLHRAVDGHRARIMEYAEDEVRMTALKAFGRAYFNVGQDFLERVTGKDWDSLIKEDGVGWEKEDDRIVIRRVKR